MKILLLGGNGFIGSHLLDELKAAGHAIRVFARDPDPWRAAVEGVEYRLGDFSDTPLLAETMQGIDVVVHLISTTVPGTSNLDPVADIRSNLINTVQLLQLMTVAGVRKIVFFSSGGTVYGLPHKLPIDEAHPVSPICSYGVVKAAIENYLGMFSHLHGLKTLILRPSNPFGPRQWHRRGQGVIATFLDRVLRDEPIVIWGDGSICRDYLYIDDLVRLCRLAIETEAEGVFNVGSGEGRTLNDIVSAMEFVTGKRARIEYAPARRFDVPEVVLDIAKARDTFGWKPEVDFMDGLERHCRWLRERL